MSDEQALNSIRAFLPCVTPDAWFEAATSQLDILLVDHANCERKAASTAMALMVRHTTRPELLKKMSQLAREELLHFQQVVELLETRGIRYVRISASRYAAGLGELVDRRSPEALVDTLIMGAFIEARSCERFAGLIPRLDAELSRFYASLLKSEARHYHDYLDLATLYHDGDIAPRVARFADLERELVSTTDNQFRFHSGSPA